MKIKTLSFNLLLIFSAGILLFAASCTVDYTVPAMEKARKFALKNTLDLTEYQRNHIRYVYPAVWKRVIFKHEPMKLTEYDHMARNSEFKPRKSDRLSYMDLSFAWEEIPGLDYTVIVLGHGEASGNFWEPLKMVYKKNAPIDDNYEKARKKAVDFVTNNMLTLSVSERDRVRFSEAEVALTNFDLSYAQEEDSKRDKKSSGLEDYLASLKKAASQKKEEEEKSVSNKDDKKDEKSVSNKEDKKDEKSESNKEDKRDEKSESNKDDKKENAEEADEEDGNAEVQYSLVWKADDPEKLIVISGISKGSSLKNWKILSGAVLPRKVFEKYLMEELYFSPADKKRGKLIPGEKDATVRVYRKSSPSAKEKELKK